MRHCETPSPDPVSPCGRLFQSPIREAVNDLPPDVQLMASAVSLDGRPQTTPAMPVGMFPSKSQHANSKIKVRRGEGTLTKSQ